VTDLVLELEKSLLRRTGKSPRRYQRVDARWLTKRRRGLIFHDPGLGKSWILLLALPRDAPVLISCPGVGKGKWEDEVRMVRPDLRPIVLDGRRAFRWPTPGEVVIVNWESLPHSYREMRRAQLRLVTKKAAKDRAEALHEFRLCARSRARLTMPWPKTVVVGDELHRAKNKDAKTTYRWHELSAMALRHGGRSWGDTGTPLVNHRRELWCVLEAAELGRRAFGSFEEFERLADEEPEEFNRRMRLVSVRRARADVLPELPEKVREVLPVRLDEALRLRCDQLAASMKAHGVRQENLTLEALRRFAAPGSPIRQAVSTVRAMLAQAKIPATLELLDELERQGVEAVVVVSAHRGPVDEIAKRPGWTRITGSESHEEKSARSRAFQAGEFRGVAVTYKAAGEVIDLYRAWRGVCVDIPWTVAAMEQFESRLQRIGQTASGLLFTRIVVDHWLERRGEEVLREKQEEIERHVEPTARKERKTA
jgi:SNF2 family DNA or RNA helicase